MNFFRKVLMVVSFVGLAGALLACGAEDESGPIETHTFIGDDGQAVEGAVYSSEASPLRASGSLLAMSQDGPMSLCEAWCAQVCGGRSNVRWCHSGGGGCSASCSSEGAVGGLGDIPEVLAPR